MKTLPMREKIAYGVGDVGNMMMLMLINFFLLTFMTDVVGISALTAGTIIMISKVWDAINDPLCGVLAAKTNTKIGAYKPWMLISLLPYVIASVALFFIPSDLSTAAKVVMLIVFYNLWSMCGTAYQIPYAALATSMTQEPNERAMLGVVREWGAKIGGLVVSTFGSSIILYFGGGELNARGYCRTAVVLGIVSALCLLITALSAKERVTPTKSIAFKDAATYLKSGGKHVVIIVLTNLVATAVPVFVSSFTVYFCLNYLENPLAITPCMTASMLAPFLALVALPVMLSKLGKRATFVFSNVVLIVGGIVALFAEANLVWVIVSFAIKGFASGFGGSVTLAMIANASEYCDKKSGFRAPSVVYSLFNFSMKVAQAGVTWISSIILTVIGYDGTLAVQSAATVNGLYLVNGWVCIIVGILGIILPMFYTLDKDLETMRETAV